MDIKSIQLQQNQLMYDYQNENDEILAHFDYNPYQSATYEQRLADLKKRRFDREHLADVLYSVNQRWNAGEDTYRNIERIKAVDSVVVVGGQQAGLLTGPAYTIHKIISIIQRAKQQEESLEVPVIPVFWIAGEDHDFAEINHIFMPQTSDMEKHKLAQRVSEKWSVSDIPIEEAYAKQWVKDIFGELEETSHTDALYQCVMQHLEASTTYVDFFARLIYGLFQDEGLVLVDAHHPEIRQFEKDFFVQMINSQSVISDGVWREQEKLQEKGYAPALGVEENEGHLFYHSNHERILLVKNSAGEWVGKRGEVTFSTSELTQIASDAPELLSNNVVTRPVMQECVLPTLAFIGGPGEVNYWSMLGPAFHALNMKMPPVLPRLSFTYIAPKMQKTLDKYHITACEAITYGTETAKENWLAERQNPSVQITSRKVKEAIEQAHRPLREIAHEMRDDIRDLSLENMAYLKRDVDFLEKRILKAMEEKYQHELQEFDSLERHLHPFNGLQERIWNPLPWINAYGSDFVKKLTHCRLSFTDGHYLVYL